MHLLNALKIEAHRFSTPPKYMFCKSLELRIETESKEIVTEWLNNDTNIYNALEINYYSTPLSSIEPGLSNKKTLKRITQKPKCPDHFPKHDFYKIYEDKKFIDPKYIIIGTKRIKNLKLSRIDQDSIEFTNININIYELDNRRNFLYNNFSQENNSLFRLYGLYNNLEKINHRIRKCKLLSKEQWFGDAYLAKIYPLQIYRKESFTLSCSELAETIKDFSEYCKRKQL